MTVGADGCRSLCQRNDSVIPIIHSSIFLNESTVLWQPHKHKDGAELGDRAARMGPCMEGTAPRECCLSRIFFPQSQTEIPEVETEHSFLASAAN